MDTKRKLPFAVFNAFLENYMKQMESSQTYECMATEGLEKWVRLTMMQWLNSAFRTSFEAVITLVGVTVSAAKIDASFAEQERPQAKKLLKEKAGSTEYAVGIVMLLLANADLQDGISEKCYDSLIGIFDEIFGEPFDLGKLLE